MSGVESISAATPAPPPARSAPQEQAETKPSSNDSAQSSGERKNASVYNTVQSASNSTIHGTGVNVVV